MADNKFLDQAGLQLVWDQIKLKFATKVDFTELSSSLTELATLVDTKASQADVDTAIAGVQQAVDDIVSELGDDYYTKDETASQIQTAVDAAINALVDGAPEALDTLKELAEMAQSQQGVIVQMQQEINTNKAAIEDLYQDSVPAYDEANKRFFGNGQPIFIADSGNNDDSVVVTYYLGTQYRTIAVPNASQVTFFGGGDGRVKNVEYPSGSIVMNSGNVRNLVGGGLDNCSMGTTSIVVNAGKVMSIMGGGFGDNNSPANGAGSVGSANIIVNDGDIFMLYGGGQNITNTGVVNVEIFGGDIDYVTTGGSNGSTSIGTVTVHAGHIGVWQAGNRGTLETSTMILEGGAIDKMYCVGETEDASVTVAIGVSNVSIRHGSVGILRMGNTDYSGHATSRRVNGEYREGIVTTDTDDILKLFNKIVDTELEAMTEQDILNICK